MSEQQADTGTLDKGKRHPLIFQRRLNEQVFWPCILILILCGGLLIWNPAGVERYRSTLQVVLVGTGLILIFTFVLRLRAYVQCRSTGLWLQLPFYHVAIPYQDIKATRLTELYRMFIGDQLGWGQRRFLEPILGKTVVILELEEQPLPPRARQLWLARAMICPNEIGLIMAVDDWLTFRTELDEAIFQHRRLPA
jgi:extradiol dioxygenase family protein